MCFSFWETFSPKPSTRALPLEHSEGLPCPRPPIVHPPIAKPAYAPVWGYANNIDLSSPIALWIATQVYRLSPTATIFYWLWHRCINYTRRRPFAASSFHRCAALCCHCGRRNNKTWRIPSLEVAPATLLLIYSFKSRSAFYSQLACVVTGFPISLFNHV